ncbi:thioredoxin domain-containing protein [Rathayibacter sp. VKM Ac-2803]|uniref:DsbA family protein n=1 Tax=Rathayibacter sp. VKM Ac-2803 TaxID=2609256 RepID=UPI001359B216|nr:DsbA family protein [Rathayibacter sp. VKM Ac-2803]MWV48969.1 thioredoxin domain-containing protein [Rathayibacter sp. VKM Ac-2803]
MLVLLRRRPAFLPTALLLATLAGCSAAPAVPVASGPTPTSAVAVTSGPTIGPTGTRGAVDFDGGFVRFGDGARIVDLYVDPLCPYCRIFEEGSAPLLFAEAEAGRATVRIHPITVLDRLSQGTQYSTRAAAAFIAVAAATPEHAQGYFEALFAHQPDENTPGLSDDELLALAALLGGDEEAMRRELPSMQGWVTELTRSALTGPLPVTDEIAAIEQVPTVVVQGAVFRGDSDETEAFAQFYAAH